VHGFIILGIEKGGLHGIFAIAVDSALVKKEVTGEGHKS